LLEAMAEHQVSVDGTRYDLAQPFFVIATQNPVETRRLPAAGHGWTALRCGGSDMCGRGGRGPTALAAASARCAAAVRGVSEVWRLAASLRRYACPTS
jgi:hypothetical protein